MYCYHIINTITAETKFIFGYSPEDAFRRAKVTNVSDWVILIADYED